MTALGFLRVFRGGLPVGKAGRSRLLLGAAGHRSGIPVSHSMRTGVPSEGVTRPCSSPHAAGRVALTLAVDAVAVTAAGVGLWGFASPNPVVVAAAWLCFPGAVLWLVYARRGK